MTARQLYEACLIELNKTQAPNLILEDFNYLANKAVHQYINKRYNVYDLNQQTTDDLRVLKNTVILKPNKLVDDATPNYYEFYGASYEVNLPNDYFHILNCICNFKTNQTFKCYDSTTHLQVGAKRLTSDMWSQVINNFYMRPTYKNPYYFINNLGKSDVGTETIQANINTDSQSVKMDGSSEFNPRTIVIGNKENLVERISENNNEMQRYGNSSNVRLEIRYGKDAKLFTLETVFVDYLRTPQYIRLTSTQIDKTTDTSQMLEFPDYVCYEIIKELVLLIMENSKDQRTQSFNSVNQAIPSGQQN